MATDARLSLMGRVPSAAQSIGIFEQAKNNQLNRDATRQQMEQRASLFPAQQQIQQQQIAAGEAQAKEQEQLRIMRSVSEFAPLIRPELEKAIVSGETGRAQQLLTKRFQDLASQGLPTDETVDAITQLRLGNPQGVLDDVNHIDNTYQQRIGAGKKQFALQSSAPIVDPVTGQVSTPVFNPSSGMTQNVPVAGAFQETPQQKAQREFKSKQELADLDISTTRKKETIKKEVARTSQLKAEFSERRRLAARSTRKIAEAQKLAEKATQGLAGASKVQLGRVFPGIDVKDEAALTGAFKSLAMDELQRFVGPTTDFEFRVTEDIAGSLGDGVAANKARLASLGRAAWFADRESQQFNNHIKAGHNPDEFFFNFNELVTPKKGGKSYSLQSLQDTAVANHISIDDVIKRLSR